MPPVLFVMQNVRAWFGLRDSGEEDGWLRIARNWFGWVTG